MNKVILLGRLTKDCEIRYTQSNIAVANFTLAVNRRTKNEGGKSDADFINCVAWDKLADIIKTYCHKGDTIGIVGRLQTRSWQDNDNKKHYVTEVVVIEVHFAGKKANSDNQGATSYPQGQDVSSTPAEDNTPYYLSEDDEDLPF